MYIEWKETFLFRKINVELGHDFDFLRIYSIFYLLYNDNTQSHITQLVILDGFSPEILVVFFT